MYCNQGPETRTYIRVGRVRKYGSRAFFCTHFACDSHPQYLRHGVAVPNAKFGKQTDGKCRPARLRGNSAAPAGLGFFCAAYPGFTPSLRSGSTRGYHLPSRFAGLSMQFGVLGFITQQPGSGSSKVSDIRRGRPSGLPAPLSGASARFIGHSNCGMAIGFVGPDLFATFGGHE